jgi:hypothetical protein
VHVVGEFEPITAEYVPLGHKTQLDEVTAFTVVEYVPAIHNVHNVEAVPGV